GAGRGHGGRRSRPLRLRLSHAGDRPRAQPVYGQGSGEAGYYGSMSIVSVRPNAGASLLIPRGLPDSGESIVAKINAALGHEDWQTGAGEGGEANTGANLGETGARVFKEKSGVTLRFRRLKAGANVTITENEDDIEIAASGGGGEGGSASTILNGEGAPSSGLGEDGDFYIDTSAWDIYGPKTSGSWGSPTPLIGPEGEPGEPGV